MVVEVSCPSCQVPMGIDDDDHMAEWECPTCAAVFQAQKDAAGGMQTTLKNPPPKPTGIEPAAAQQRTRGSRKRRRAHLNQKSEPADDEPDLDISIDKKGAAPPVGGLHDMQPVTTNPVLFTLNGLGFTFYGHRDFDAYSGTYVKSHCFCIFFIPIFFVGAYRVLDGDAGGWHILGKVPISTTAQTWNWAMLGFLMLATLMCLITR